MPRTAQKHDLPTPADTPASPLENEDLAPPLPADEEDAPRPADEDDSPYALAAYMGALYKRPLLTATEEVALATRIARGDRAAHCLLVESNLRLVVTIARRYLRKVHHMAFLDLIAEGNTGLMRAADKFDASRGFRFSTYAVWWIRQNIERALMNQERMIRTPVHIRKVTDRLYAVTQRLTSQIGRAPTITELAQHTGLSADDIPRLQAFMYDMTVSGDESWDEDGHHTFFDNLIDPNLRDPIDIVAHKEAAARLQNALAQLRPRHRKVLMMRYGIPDGDTHTLASIAATLGVTRERVRQIQVLATRELRALLARKAA